MSAPGLALPALRRVLMHAYVLPASVVEDVREAIKALEREQPPQRETCRHEAYQAVDGRCGSCGVWLSDAMRRGAGL